MIKLFFIFMLLFMAGALVTFTILDDIKTRNEKKKDKERFYVVIDDMRKTLITINDNIDCLL